MITVALPVFRSRIAPVFDFSHRVLVIRLKDDREIKRVELQLEGHSAAQRVDALTREGVTTLICGGISEDLHALLEVSGICVVCGIAGQVEEVFAAFVSDRLHEPPLHMPGHRDKKGGDATGPREHGTKRLK